MFFHKSKPLATGFACAAAAMIISVAANPAQADRDTIISVAANPAQDDRRSYCDEPGCIYPVGGIVQKERDGVNYFYGGIHVETPNRSYIHVFNSNVDQPYEVLIPPSNLYTTSFEAPLFRHRFRLNKDNRRMHRRHPGLLKLPGLHSGDKFMGP